MRIWSSAQIYYLMAEKGPNNVYGTEKEKAEGPALLDVVQIDGRWAQVYTIISPDSFGVRFLDSQGGATNMVMTEYQWEPLPGGYVGDLINVGDMTEGEAAKIYWDSSKKGTEPDDRKRIVTIFGKCTKKK